MKQYIPLVALHADHEDLEITTFLNVMKWFVFWVRQGVCDQLTSLTWTIKCCQWSNGIQIVEFLQQVEVMVSENPEKLIMATDDQPQVAE